MSAGTLPAQKGPIATGKTPVSQWLAPALSSTVGSKFIVAITGAILVVFLISHLAGNLLIFKGPDAVNAYAQGLKDLGGLLWAARIGLLIAFVFHVYFAIRLQIRNKSARPERYRYPGTVQATTASVTMLMSGLLVLAFLLYHLAHYTFGMVHGTENGTNLLDLRDHLGRHNVYAMTIAGFSKWWVTASYIVAQLVLWFHLSHGIGSMFQTLGWNSQNYWLIIRRTSLIVATLIVAGNILIPVAVFLGMVK